MLCGGGCCDGGGCGGGGGGGVVVVAVVETALVFHEKRKFLLFRFFLHKIVQIHLTNVIFHYKSFLNQS